MLAEDTESFRRKNSTAAIVVSRYSSVMVDDSKPIPQFGSEVTLSYRSTQCRLLARSKSYLQGLVIIECRSKEFDLGSNMFAGQGPSLQVIVNVIPIECFRPLRSKDPS